MNMGLDMALDGMRMNKLEVNLDKIEIKTVKELGELVSKNMSTIEGIAFSLKNQVPSLRVPHLTLLMGKCFFKKTFI